MPILQALASRYERQACAGEAPILGFAPVPIGFAIVLTASGDYCTTQDERVDDGRKRRGRIVMAPAAPKRTLGVASGAFWDRTSYVLGRTQAGDGGLAKDAARVAREHAAFVARHTAMLDDSDDPGCRALLRFLQDWSPERYDGLAYAMAMLGQNVAFRLAGDAGFIHDRPAARAALLAEADAGDPAPAAMCLVTGQVAPIARLHPSIKGVIGALSAGASLVSFNLDSCTSYGKTQGSNAPVSQAAAFAYGTALNGLLTPSGTNADGRAIFRNRVTLGETTVAFWAEQAATEIPMRTMLEGGDLPPARDIDPKSRVYVLGLSPNVARLSVRFWVEQSFADFTTHFQQHWQDLRLDPAPFPAPPPLWRLLLELAAQRKPENIPPHLGGEVMRSILTGAPYPRALLAQTIMRIRADRDEEDPRTGRMLEKISDLRVALLKACLARMYRWNQIAEDVPMSLDRESTNSAYRLGRLFAVFERLQFAAVGQRHATLRDRFYGPASATPALVFSSLIRGARNHSKSVRSRAGAPLADWYEDHIAEIASGLEDNFPRTLPLEEQGRFALGYYHQRDVFRRTKDEAALDEAPVKLN